MSFCFPPGFFTSVKIVGLLVLSFLFSVTISSCKSNSSSDYHLNSDNKSDHKAISYSLEIMTTNGSIISRPSGIDCGSTCSKNFLEGVSIQLIATPDSKYMFTGWSGDCSGLTNLVTVTMDNDRICLASFKRPLLPDTGQIKSYTSTTGEDRDYKINSPSFAINGDTIIDNNTGLTWQKDGRPKCRDNSIRCSWNDAKTYCSKLSLEGRNDWRLPSFRELMSIVDYGKKHPSINSNYFPNVATDTGYWSSTSYDVAAYKVWYVDFDFGNMFSKVINNKMYVRCVRGRTNFPVVPELVDNKDGTVTDKNTGLIWQQNGDAKHKWKKALTYCENLKLPADSEQNDDWRLPNIRELQSIVDGSKDNPAINLTIFPKTMSLNYWSSTTGTNNQMGAWKVYFGNGQVNCYAKKSTNYVRCVRGGSRE
jgi:hypothetical protein